MGFVALLRINFGGFIVKIRKKIIQIVLVLGWLIWSLPVFAIGDHEGHPGKSAPGSAKTGKHGGYSGSHGGGKGKHGGGHGYGRRKGPPKDIPAHIIERMDKDGTKINLNGSQIGVKGMKILASTPDLKNIVSLALQTNKLGDEGVRILCESDTFQHVEKLSLWGNDVSEKGAKMIAESQNLKNLTELMLTRNKLGDEGIVSLVS